MATLRAAQAGLCTCPVSRPFQAAASLSAVRRPAQRRLVRLRADAGEPGQSSASPAPAVDAPVADPAVISASEASSSGTDNTEEEVVFYEGAGSNAELVFSLLMLPTLIYAPLSIASIGRRAWIKFRFTNKRLAVINTSPLFKRTIEIAYKNIKDIRTGPRAFGLWGDMVIFLRDGSRIELSGLDKYKEIEQHIKKCIYTL